MEKFFDTWGDTIGALLVMLLIAAIVKVVTL